jgi:hypothetical protein
VNLTAVHVCACVHVCVCVCVTCMRAHECISSWQSHCPIAVQSPPAVGLKPAASGNRYMLPAAQEQQGSFLLGLSWQDANGKRTLLVGCHSRAEQGDLIPGGDPKVPGATYPVPVAIPVRQAKSK